MDFEIVLTFTPQSALHCMTHTKKYKFVVLNLECKYYYEKHILFLCNWEMQISCFSSNLFRDLAAISQDYSEVTIPIYLYANKFKTIRNDNWRQSAYIYQ